MEDDWSKYSKTQIFFVDDGSMAWKIRRNIFLIFGIIFLQTHEQLWLEIAEKVTMCVQQIIEFAKMVPSFMSLLQDDQIMLLKGKIVARETSCR